MNITEITSGSKNSNGLQSIAAGNIAGGLSRAAGITSGSSPFADNLNSQFSLKSQSASQLATQLSQHSLAVSDAHAKAQKAAQGLVSNALILPILKQIRRSQDEQKGFFSPGNGEKTFGPQFDMQLSDRIAQSPNLGITKSLTAKLEKRSASPAKATTSKAQTKLDVHG